MYHQNLKLSKKNNYNNKNKNKNKFPNHPHRFSIKHTQIIPSKNKNTRAFLRGVFATLVNYSR